MKNEKKLKELEPANLDEVTGGLAPLVAYGLYLGGAAAVGWVAKSLYDQHARPGPQSVPNRPGVERRVCDGVSRQNGDGSRSFRPEGCRQMGLW